MFYQNMYICNKDGSSFSRALFVSRQSNFFPTTRITGEVNKPFAPYSLIFRPMPTHYCPESLRVHGIIYDAMFVIMSDTGISVTAHSCSPLDTS